MFNNWFKKVPKEEEQELKQKISLTKNDEKYFLLKWTFEADGRAKMACDWDDAFIRELRRRGFNGSSDETIVQKFLTYIHSNGLGEDEGDENEFK